MNTPLLVFGLIIFCASSISGQSCKNEKKCRFTRAHKMKGADCYQRDIRNFPQCLPNDIEIIDLASNRIRKLNKNDLTKYSNLKMLYLTDNVLTSVDENVFDDKDELTTLDLSVNGISKLPPVVFHLPSLRNLYLGQNSNMNVVDAVDKAKPLSSPLVQLDISWVLTEEPNVLPDLGMMPQLVKYNISGSVLLDVTTNHFAGLCSLKILDTSNVTAEFNDLCHCWTLNWWLQTRKVIFTPFQCAINENDCPHEEVPQDDLKLYSDCKKEIETIIHKSRMVKIFVPIGVVAGLILIVIAYFGIRKRRQKLRELRNKSPPLPDGQMLL